MKNRQLDHRHYQPTKDKYPVCLLAHDIERPTNIGSLFRIADALGVEKIYLSGSSLTPPNNKISKTSRATEKVVPFSYIDDPIDLLARLKAERYTIISLEISTLSIDILDLQIRPDEKICLILGSENKGVSQELLDASDKTVHIKMQGQNSSMNIASACSIAVFEIIRKFNPK